MFTQLLDQEQIEERMSGDIRFSEEVDYFLVTGASDKKGIRSTAEWADEKAEGGSVIWFISENGMDLKGYKEGELQELLKDLDSSFRFPLKCHLWGTPKWKIIQRNLEARGCIEVS